MAQQMRMLATESIGPSQALTPEGYLICVGVPIARTGSQLYAAHELPKLAPGTDGTIRVHRDEVAVFSDETIASFEGKSVVVGHRFVDSHNVKQIEAGHAQNVRRSETEPDLLLADLLIKDARAIDQVRVDPARPNKKVLREVSCGYDAQYVQDAPGVARLRNIVGNHIALVERGRAGPRCSIQDEDIFMQTKDTGTLLQRLLKAIRTKDEDLIARATADAEEIVQTADEQKATEAAQKTADTIAALTKTVDELTAQVAKLTPAPAPTITDAEKVKTADALKDVASRAEILVPGFAMPTADSVKTFAEVAGVQRTVLNEAMKTEDGKKIVMPLLSGRTVDELTADVAPIVFAAASEIARQQNNARGNRNGIDTTKVAKAVTPADINERNRKFYENQH